MPSTEPSPDPVPSLSFADHLNRLEERLAVLLLVAMTVLVGAQVVARFIFSAGFSWMDELARVAFVWVVFLGAIVAMRRCLHIRVLAGIRSLPARWQPWIEAVGDIATLLFCCAMAWHGLELMLSTLRFSFDLPATRLSMFWVYLIMPLSFGLQVLRLGYVIATRRRDPLNV